MRKSLMALTALAVVSLLPLTAQPSGAAAQQLQTWSGSITSSSGTTYPFTMVGTDPSTTNGTTTIPVFIIPIKVIYANATFDPVVDQWHGMSIVDALIASPLFNNLNWTWGGTNIGTTQYVDAFQRASFWQDVSINTNYHVRLAAPAVLVEQTIDMSTITAPTICGQVVGEISGSTMDAYLQTYLTEFSVISPSALALFVTENIGKETANDGGANCSSPGGGFHKSNPNGQTYAWASFWTFSDPGFPAHDIQHFAHELGEWYDDPYAGGAQESQSPCGILEVADPLQGPPAVIIPVSTVSGLAWHPQALAFMQYFGEPANFSANNWLDNANNETAQCQNGP
jgi:hypothetical protein